jgi:hypothetical protein
MQSFCKRQKLAGLEERETKLFKCPSRTASRRNVKECTFKNGKESFITFAMFRGIFQRPRDITSDKCEDSFSKKKTQKLLVISEIHSDKGL